MSFILDALKKSEAERQRQAGPAMFEAPTSRPHRGVPTWVVVAGALLVLANLVGLVWLMLRQPPKPLAATPATLAAPIQPTAGAASATTAAAAVAAAPGTVPATPSADSTALPPLPTELEPEPPEEARIANLKRWATLGSTAPALRLDLHVYSSDPAARYALINMRKLREGETNEDGIKIKEITRTGVVVVYRGEELLLARD